jgi:DNA-binding response OmpR family regulator
MQARGIRILVVDDLRDQRESLQRLLEMQGYEVSTAVDGSQAVHSQRARPAQILLTDIFMPGQEGIETIALFRRQWPEVRIIAMSGGAEFSRNGYLGVAETVGADATLHKPFSFDSLLAAIASLKL